jgi:hypothetical protein
MIAIERVMATRRILGAGAVIQAVGWGIAVTLAILAVLSFGTLAIPALADNSGVQAWLAVGAGVAVSAGLFWRSRHIRSVGRDRYSS